MFVMKKRIFIYMLLLQSFLIEVMAQDGIVTVAGTCASADSLLYASMDSRADGKDISAPAASITNMLYGRIPGLGVYSSTGEPGYDAAKLSIRGVSTYNNSSIPVYVDGFRINSTFFEYMPAAEIGSIRVLKDAAELAPFGMQGANGVIWVTTRRGKPDRPVINLELKSGIQQLQSYARPYGTDDWCRLYNEAWSNDNGMKWTQVWSDGDAALKPDVDWYDQVLRNASPYTETDVTISGGGTHAKYFIAAGYMNQQGMYNVPINDTLSNAAVNRFNLRTNIDVYLGKWVEAQIGVGGRIEQRQYPNRPSSDLWDDLASYPSGIYPVRNANGTWTGTPVYNNNPVASINATGRNSTHDRTLQFNFRLKEDLGFITPGLYLSEDVSVSSWVRDGAGNTRTYARYLYGEMQTADIDTPYSRYENSGTDQWNWKQFRISLGYDKAWKKHSVSASLSGYYGIYASDPDLNGEAGDLIWYRKADVTGAFVYQYDRRLSASLLFSVSGSDNYKKAWGFYPAVSASYVFLDGRNSRNVDCLKIRGSVGRNGWDPIGEKRFLWENYHFYEGGIYLGNGSPSWNGGFTPMYEGNPDIFAETSMKYDIGLDGSLWSGKLKFALDLFREDRSGIVTQDFTEPGTAGISHPAYRNIGRVANMGFDLSASYGSRVGDFSYGVSFIGSFAANRITGMAEVITVPSAALTGHPIGSVFGYMADGFYDVDDFDADGNLLSPLPTSTLGKVQPGDIKYRDLNGDTVIDEQDKTMIGRPLIPMFNYSFALTFGYRGFDLSLLFQGTGGRQVNLLDAPLQTIAFRDNTNVYPIASERWVYYPEQGLDTRASASYPRLSLLENHNNYVNSTLWIRNGDFLKLRNLEFGWTLPHKWMSQARISNLRLYFRGLNLLTFSYMTRNYGMDPEVLSGHPAMKSYNFGFNITF